MTTTTDAEILAHAMGLLREIENGQRITGTFLSDVFDVLVSSSDLSIPVGVYYDPSIDDFRDSVSRMSSDFRELWINRKNEFPRKDQS